ncbi:MAG: DNA translocase FtsK 4TM domain-containing protein [Pseudomonadota bacterium]
MAYQARQRDPLFDAETQAILERRGKELVGVALSVVGALTIVMLATYFPDDPSWLSSTDAPVRNALGRTGASLASPLYVILGVGVWLIPVFLVAWGFRLIAHWGADRIPGRAIFAPFAVALASVYASTLLPSSGWTHSFGLGGLLGDTVLGATLSILPVGTVLGLKALSVVMAFASAALTAFVLGLTKAEIAAAGRFLLLGVIFAYAGLVRLLILVYRGLVSAIFAARERLRASVDEEDSNDNIPEFMTFEIEDDEEMGEPQTGGVRGLLARAPSLLMPNRGEIDAPRPAPRVIDETRDIEAPSDDHIRARIADAIRLRTRSAPDDGAHIRAEPPVMAHPDPEPEVLDDDGHDFVADDTQTDHGALPTHFSSDGLHAANAASRGIVQNPVRKSPAPSRQAQAEAQPRLKLGDDKSADYEFPALSLLTSSNSVSRHVLSDEALDENARMLEAVLDDYGVKGEIVSVRPGPVVTMYELEPAPGLKASRVIGLADDIARSMSALSARVSTVPGRSVIGIELPNAHREMVLLREILSARDFGDGKHRLPLALGKDIGGDPVVANLAKMPHLLIAGTTGSGKSVAINTMILSLLYKLSPQDCRMIMIDPKMLELSVYDGIPHLLSPVVTDPKKAVVALKWVVGEMEERYRKMSKMGVRNIEGHNGRVREALAKNEMFKRTVQTGFDDETGDPVFETEEFLPEPMPYIVVIVDEMADLMMVAGKEIEACIQRLAQMARASGIHLIMATQRPSVDVITGTIKANFPTRISFQVTSKVDSRTILGEMGAEQLLGMGDMLYMAGGAKITRVHGPFVSDEEVEEVVQALKLNGAPDYVGGVVDGPDDEKEGDIDLVLGLGGNTDGEDALYDQAVQVVIQDRKCSTSYIQRKLAIGYNKAARLVEQMEEQGLVSPANHVGKREILIPEQEGR